MSTPLRAGERQPGRYPQHRAITRDKCILDSWRSRTSPVSAAASRDRWASICARTPGARSKRSNRRSRALWKTSLSDTPKTATANKSADRGETQQRRGVPSQMVARSRQAIIPDHHRPAEELLVVERCCRRSPTIHNNMPIFRISSLG
jgi:hypothetical protein